MGLRLVNVMTNGLLYVVAREGAVAGLAGPEGDVTLSSPATPMEAVQMLLAGRA
jgi:hypothetical protein